MEELLSKRRSSRHAPAARLRQERGAFVRSAEPMVAVLEADPGLGVGLSAVELSAARREALAPALRLTPGLWGCDAGDFDARGHLGLLVLEGLLARRATLGELDYTELLGAGDVLRPWTAEVHATLPTADSWEALVETRIAVLDRDFALRVRSWPELTASLLERATMRARSLGVILAIHRAVRVEERLELMLWHLADRWGYVGPDGTVLRLPLTHESLARLIGARRSPVTVAVGNLKRDGTLSRGPRGSWILSRTTPHDRGKSAREPSAREAPTLDGIAP